MHKLAESDQEVRFVVESPLAVTTGLVESAYVSGKRLRLTYPWMTLQAGQFDAFLKDYIVTLGVVAPRWAYNAADAIFPVRRAIDDEAAKTSLLKSYDESYATAFPDLVESGVSGRETLEKIANARNTRLVEIDGRPAGSALIEVLKDFSGVHRAHVGWLWLNRQLTKPVRRQVMASLAAEAGRMVPGPLFAQVYVGNLPSLKTALNLGCKSLCATFTRRQH